MILVTGGAGYVGTILTEKLLEKGHKVSIFDKFYFGKGLINDKNLQVHEGDIRNFPEEILDGVNTVIHLAGLSNDPTSEFNPQANYQINTQATIDLARSAKKKGVKKFIFASSCSIYDLGYLKKVFQKNESSRVKPTAAYSNSKYKAEIGILKTASSDFCVTIFRKGTVFGFSPRMRYDLVVNTMVKDALCSGEIKIYGQGRQWRPLVDVEDVAQAYISALDANPAHINKKIINISLGNFMVRDLALQIEKVLKSTFNLNCDVIFTPMVGKARCYKVSNDLAKKVLNYTAGKNLAASIEKMVKMIKEKGYNDFSNPLYYNIEWMRPILEKGI